MKVLHSELCYHCDETHENILKKKFIKPSQTELLMKYYNNNKIPLEGYKVNIDEENYTAKFSVDNRKKARGNYRIARYGNPEDLDCYRNHKNLADDKLYFYCEENDDVITVPKE